MADLFSKAALGEAVLIIAQLTLKAEADITKGQVVIANTHTAEELVSVSPAGAAAANVIGVAMQDISAGEWGPILICGIIKVTASGAIVAGIKVVTGAAGVVVTVGANTFEKVIGFALQDFGDGDTGLIWFGGPG